MWLFTRYGFYSIACASKASGGIDQQTLMIRARNKRHLEKLQARFPLLAEAEIITTPIQDYRYRIIVLKSDWTRIVAELAEEQTWSNFKSEAARFQGKAATDYVHALHDVWSVMYKIQDTD